MFNIKVEKNNLLVGADRESLLEYISELEARIEMQQAIIDEFADGQDNCIECCDDIMNVLESQKEVVMQFMYSHTKEDMGDLLYNLSHKYLNLQTALLNSISRNCDLRSEFIDRLDEICGGCEDYE